MRGNDLLRETNGTTFTAFPFASVTEHHKKRITYAKTKSYATLSREDPNFVPPNVNASNAAAQNAKRSREDDKGDERQAKREKSDESSDEEMEIEDDDDAPAQSSNSCTSRFLVYLYASFLINLSTSRQCNDCSSSSRTSNVAFTLHESSPRSHQ